MWRKLSLRLRINLLFATLLTAALAANVATLITGAGARVRAEVGASTRLSADFVEAALAGLRSAQEAQQDPKPALMGLIDNLQNLRHVQIYLSEDGKERPFPPPPDDSAAGRVPSWFAALAHQKPSATRIQADIGGRNYGQIVIASYPWNEISEVWRDVRNLTLGGALLTVIVFALTYAVAGRALAPIRLISEGLTRLKEGDYAVSIAPGGAPELRDICAKLNNLAKALGGTMAENRLLTQKLISMQDDERKELARELHDEMGPYLFAIRAGALSLAGQAERGAVDAAAFSDVCRALVEQVNEVQRMNASTLRRLRPQALSDLGATAALEALAGAVCRMAPALDVTLSLPPGLDAVDETAALTIYRIVQEGLTNVRRHADATQAEIVVEISHGMIRLSVRDNGVGLPTAPRQGLGLLGMSERVQALGGSMELTGAEGEGATLTVTLPVNVGARS
jgi:two-component system, NarL family, sensor histidine kinase UhpB